jgi:glutaredoxin
MENGVKSLALYEFEACPFCQKVMDYIEAENLKVEYRNIREDPAFREELVEGGGKSTVPCLRITQTDDSHRWLYESDDIIEYLETHGS